MHLAFVTNNASRTPDSVSDHLVELGVAAEPGDVVTSAQAPRTCWPTGSARREGVPARRRGLRVALEEEGLEPVGPRRTTRSRWSPATAPTCCGATSCAARC